MILRIEQKLSKWMMEVVSRSSKAEELMLNSLDLTLVLVRVCL